MMDPFVYICMYWVLCVLICVCVCMYMYVVLNVYILVYCMLKEGQIYFVCQRGYYAILGSERL